MTPRTGSGDHYVAWLWRKTAQAKREGHKAITLVRFWRHLRNLGIIFTSALLIRWSGYSIHTIHGLIMHCKFNLIY
jgi:hypothetical protein